MRIRIHFMYLLGFGLLLLGQSVRGAILVEEVFSHPDGNLVGQLPLPGPGSAWEALANQGNTAIQVVDGRAVLSQGSGSGGREDAIIAFGRQPNNATTYARFDFLLPGSANSDIVNLDAEGSNFVHFKSNLLTTHFRARTGVLAPAGSGDFQLAINANGGRLNEGTVWTTELNFDTLYRVVVSWNAATGESKLWLNPTDELSTSISSIGHSMGQRLEAFALRQSSDYTGTQYVDNLVVATTFADALFRSSAGFTGDYNQNGVVDAADYVLWRKQDGTQSGYNAWRSNFGAAAGADLIVSGSVPEPSTLLPLNMILVGIGWRREIARQ